MAGSFNHVVWTESNDGDAESSMVKQPEGSLLEPADLLGMLECSSGDVYEAIEEMYGMIYYLAEQYTRLYNGEFNGWLDNEDMIEEARVCYKKGLELSPTPRFKDS